MNEPTQYTVSEFDRLVGLLKDLPDVTKTKPSTVREELPIIGLARTLIIQTYRHREKGDTIFFETIGPEGSIRFAIPPAAADIIARQREALTAKSRSKAAKQVMADRMAAGHKPAFLVKKEKKA